MYIEIGNLTLTQMFSTLTLLHTNHHTAMKCYITIQCMIVCCYVSVQVDDWSGVSLFQMRLGFHSQLLGFSYLELPIFDCVMYVVIIILSIIYYMSSFSILTVSSSSNSLKAFKISSLESFSLWNEHKEIKTVNKRYSRYKLGSSVCM